MEAPVRGALSSRSSCHSGPSRPKGFAYRGVSARPVSQRNEGLLVEVDRGKAVAALCPRSLSALATVSTLRAATPDVQLLPVKFVGVRLPLLDRVFQRCPIVTDYCLVGTFSRHRAGSINASSVGHAGIVARDGRGRRRESARLSQSQPETNDSGPGVERDDLLVHRLGGLSRLRCRLSFSAAAAPHLVQSQPQQSASSPALHTLHRS